MKRALLSVLAVLAALAAAPTSQAGASSSFCGLGFPANDTFVWTGATHDHKWQTPGNWTVGGVTATVAPGSPYDAGGPANLDDPSRDVDYVCIGSGGQVTLGGTTDNDIVGPAVAALDLGQHANLTVTYASKLWLNRAQSAAQPSKIRAGSTLTLQGATLGGKGTLSVSGTLDAVTLPSFPVTITTRYCDVPATPCPTVVSTRGLLLVAVGGVFAVDGNPVGSALAGINLEDGRYVDNSGTIRLANKGYVAADHGTTIKNEASGTIDIANDQGIYEGRNRYSNANAKLNNYGTLAKSAGTGNSIVGATYQGFGAGTVGVSTGTLTTGSSKQSAGVTTPQANVAPGAAFGLGSCTGTSGTTSSNTCTSYSVSSSSPQAATVTVSPASTGSTQVQVATQTSGLPSGTHGQAVQFETPNATPTTAQPNTFTLFYDSSVLGGEHLADLQIQRAEDNSTVFATLPDCLSGGALPTGAASCVDRAASSDQGNDVIVVIRTTQNSRYIAR